MNVREIGQVKDKIWIPLVQLFYSLVESLLQFPNLAYRFYQLLVVEDLNLIFGPGLGKTPESVASIPTMSLS